MRLHWTHTGLGNREDYTAADADHPDAFCRVYRSVGNSTGLQWYWTASDGHVDLGHGYAATAREAAALAEAAYAARSKKRERDASAD